MPVSYRIDKARGLIRTRCEGYVTLPEVVAHFRDLVADDECPRRLDVLLDLSEITSLPSSDQLRTVSGEIARIRGVVEFGACAILVSTEAAFGTALVFEVLAARGFRTTKVFRESGTAEAWLADQGSGS